MQDLATLILVFVVFPLWVTAGLADWICHVRTGIALTSGLKENLLHWLMFAQVGAGIAAVVLLEINAGVLLIVFAIFVVHELTVYWDLRYSTLLRDVGPFEQMVHSFMEILPLLSLALLAFVAAGDAPADWSLRWKEEPLPANYLVAGLLLVGVFNAVPLLQETFSCIKGNSVNGVGKGRPDSRQPSTEQPREPVMDPRAKPVADTGAEARLEPALDGPPKARTPANPAPR